MGKSKQLLTIQGVSLLEHTILVAKKVCSPVAVILGSQFENHQQVISHLAVDVVENKRWSEGMGSSLKAGLSHLAALNPDAVIVLVSDQPLLTANHLKALVEAYQVSRKPIVGSAYSNTVGVPALFVKEIFSKLFEIENAEGARKVIAAFPEQVASVAFEGGEIDLDTEGDYNAFIKGTS